MTGEILALLDDSIGPKLLLASRLGAAGYSVTVHSNPGAFGRSLETGVFEWVIVEETRTRGRTRLLRRLARPGRPGRIVWLGRPPRRVRLPIEAAFDKPLDYDEIVRFFSEREEGGRMR